MGNIQGKIVHQESFLGIPNLIVVVYDIDPDSQGPLEEPNPDFNENPENVIRMLWNTFPGDRLGSAITDSQGNFQLSYSEEDYRLHTQQEIRPDLYLYVFAPTQTNEQGWEHNPLEALLYRTTTPIFNAGRTESIVIRLSTGSLRNQGLPLPKHYHTQPDSPATRTAAYSIQLNRTEQLRSGLQQAVQNMQGQSLGQQLSRRREAHQWANQLLKTPIHLQEGPLFVRNDEERATAQQHQLEQGVAWQQRYGERTRVHLNLSSDQLADLIPGFDPSNWEDMADSVTTLDIEMGHLCRFLRQHSHATELQRTRTVWESILQRYQADDTLEQLSSDSPPSPEEPPTPDMERSLAEELRELIGAQLNLTSSFESINTQDSTSLPALQQRIHSFELHSGPADTTAYHDFHTLQIAFADIWAEAFDEHLRDRMADLYHSLVKVREEVDPTAEWTDFADMRTMEDYTRFLTSINTEISSLGADLVPEIVLMVLPRLLLEDWNKLSPTQQLHVVEKAEDWRSTYQEYQNLEDQLRLTTDEVESGRLGSQLVNLDDRLMALRSQITQIIEHPDSSLSRVQEMLQELAQRMTEPYAFDVFAPDTVNFGIMTTYRQRWEPQNYQAGSLVATIPLAPGESRKYTKKSVTKKSRSRKQIEKSTEAGSTQQSYTSRAQSEITRKASTATNFQQNVEGTINFGVGSITSNTGFGLNQQQESSRAKSAFREAVAKASQEYKNERHLEVSTTDSQDIENTTSGEIKNANNEITTTYLFYELERQYRISEYLHRVTPVILVAQDVPKPNEIDEDWLLSHQWILKRVLLDNSFEEALDFLSDGLTGDEINVLSKERLMKDQRQLVEDLRMSFDEKLATRDTLMEALRQVSGEEGMAKVRKDRSKIARIGKAIFTGGASMVLPTPGPGGTFDGSEATAEVLKANREAIERRLELLKEEIPGAKAEVNKAISALERATQAYTEASSASLRKKTLIEQLRIHVKQNILYYMQAIWDHEPPDQRFFRLYNVDVRLPMPDSWNEEEAERSHITVRTAPAETELADALSLLGTSNLFSIWVDLPPPGVTFQQRKLHQVADLDRPLGFKGNYMIFPMKECTYLSDFMMQDYIDGYLGVRDPDDAYNDFSSREELVRFAEQVYDRLNEEEQLALRRVLLQRLTSARKDDELIVVPTGQLFIEALPGVHPLLEKYKLQHRQMDVEKVRAEVMREHLENLRYVERLDAELLEDPDIDKKVLIQGDMDTDVAIETE